MAIACMDLKNCTGRIQLRNYVPHPESAVAECNQKITSEVYALIMVYEFYLPTPIIPVS
jgi:hypothetical protein